MTRRFVSFFLLHIPREHAVGNPSAIEGQTANILNSQTGLLERCSTSLLEFQKHLMSLLAETKRRVIPATKFKFFNDKISEKRLESWEQIAGWWREGFKFGVEKLKTTVNIYHQYGRNSKVTNLDRYLTVISTL